MENKVEINEKFEVHIGDGFLSFFLTGKNSKVDEQVSRKIEELDKHTDVKFIKELERATYKHEVADEKDKKRSNRRPKLPIMKTESQLDQLETTEKGNINREEIDGR